MIRHVAHWEVGDVTGPVVAIDVIRAFTAAAYTFAVGAHEIHLVETLGDAYALLDANPTWLAMGEEHGKRPERFALSNSPVHASTADLDGRTIVQRTSAGTRGALAARRAHAHPRPRARPPRRPHVLHRRRSLRLRDGHHAHRRRARLARRAAMS